MAEPDAPQPTERDTVFPDAGEPPASASQPDGVSAVAAPGNNPRPFEVAEALESPEPTEAAALDPASGLTIEPPRRIPGWQKGLTFLLLLTLAGQLAWMERERWIDHPMVVRACAAIDCRLPEYRRPEDFHVIEREMQLVPGEPPVLRLWLAMRNDGRLAQPLPRLELSLLDGLGVLVARRTFAPQEYLPSDWSGPTTARPGEVITIELGLRDPGPWARSFTIEFL